MSLFCFTGAQFSRGCCCCCWSGAGAEKGVENVVGGAPVKITNSFRCCSSSAGGAASVSYRFGARAHLHLQRNGRTNDTRDYDTKRALDQLVLS